MKDDFSIELNNFLSFDKKLRDTVEKRFYEERQRRPTNEIDRNLHELITQMEKSVQNLENMNIRQSYDKRRAEIAENSRVNFNKLKKFYETRIAEIKMVILYIFYKIYR
jgi:hypothetical protein